MPTIYDPISLQRLAKLHPKLRDEATRLYKLACDKLTGRADVRIVQGYRTYAEQDALYAQGRTKPGKIVTNAKAGSSYHNFGVAVDFCLLIDGKEVSWDIAKDWDGDGAADWREVVAVFEAGGWSWGGKWSSLKDYPHLEKSFGHPVSIWRSRKAAKKVDAEGYVIV